MHRWTRNIWLMLTPTLILSVTLLGCSGSDKDKAKAKPKDGAKAKSNEDDENTDDKARTPVKGKSTTTITGTVKFKGDMPNIKEMNEKFLASVTKNKEVCLAPTAKESEKTDYRWRINKENKGVQNVFVWIKPLKDSEYFDVSDLVKKKEGFDLMKKLDQPHCAFLPHAFVLFQHYIKDPKDKITKTPSTGQVLEVLNSAEIPHNTQWSGAEGRVTGGNETIPAKGKKVIGKLYPSYEKPITFSCNIHGWMKAYAWSFEHPFAAVTDKDGKFEIKNVPAEVKVRIVVWHEVGGWANGGKDGEEIEIKGDGAKKDFTIGK